MKKYGFIVILFFIFFGCAERNAYSKKDTDTIEVTAIGEGKDKDTALDDAFKNAVRNAFGTLVYNEDTINNRRLIEEKLLIYSKGYIENYKEIEANFIGQTVFVKITALVSTTKIKTAAKEFNKTPDSRIEESHDIVADFKKLKSTQDKLTEGAQLMDKFIGKHETFFERAYRVKLIGYKIDNMSAKKIDWHYLVDISLNEIFWNQYKEILSALYIKQNDKPSIDVTGNDSADAILTKIDNLLWGKFSKEGRQKRDDAYYDSISSDEWRKARKKARERELGIISTKKVTIRNASDCSGKSDKIYVIPEVIPDVPTVWLYLSENEILGWLKENTIRINTDASNYSRWLAGIVTEEKLIYSKDGSKNIRFECSGIFNEDIVIKIPMQSKNVDEVKEFIKMNIPFKRTRSSN